MEVPTLCMSSTTNLNWNWISPLSSSKTPHNTGTVFIFFQSNSGLGKSFGGSVSDQPRIRKKSLLPRRADTRRRNSGRTGKERRCAWPSPTAVAVFLSGAPPPPPPGPPVPGKPPPAETPDVPRAASAEHSLPPSSWQPFLQCFGSALVSIRTQIQFYLNAEKVLYFFLSFVKLI